jgi:parvulin-like peptidyl-prolyl isomerase
VRARTLAALGLILVLMAAGCGPREPIVARIGNEKITLKQFKEAFIANSRSEETAARRSYQDRETVLHDLAVQRAKFLEAVALGIDKKPDIKKQIETFARRKALDMLYEDKVVNAVVSDAAAKEYYDRSGKEVKARHILLKVNPSDVTAGDTLKIKARADSIRKAIAGGLDFRAAAKMLSEDASTAADSGSLGWFGWGKMVDEFQEAVWNAKTGAVAGPVRTPYGYHLILVEETRPVPDRRPFDEVKAQVKAQMKESEGAKMTETAKNYLENLRKKRNLKYNDATLDMFRKRLLDPNASKSQGLAPLFTEDQKTMAAASYSGGKITVADMIEKVGTAASRVDWNDPQSVKDLVNAIAEPKFLDDDADSQGYYKKALNDPEVVAERERGLAGMLEKQEVTDKLNPTPQDEQAYYQNHLSAYIQPEMRTVREIFVKADSMKAVRIRERALKGENFLKLAMRFNEKESTQPDTGRIGPFEEKRFGLTGHSAFALQKVGGVSEVIAIGKNYSVLQLLEIVPSRTKTFEEAHLDVTRQCRTDMTDAAMKALADKLLKKYKYDVDAKVLGSAWPVQDKSATPQSGQTARPQ